MNRRGLLLEGVGLVLVGAGRAQAQATAPALGFIASTAGRMTAIIDGSDSASSKAAQLQAVVDATVDVEGIAQFCLGRYWRAASPEQQRAFLQLFHRVLLDGVTGQISAYKGVTVTLGRTLSREDGTVVSSTVQRPGQGPAKVDWLVASTSAGLRIEDVIAEGTSLRLTRRNDYASYLASHGGNIDALLDAMRRQR